MAKTKWAITMAVLALALAINCFGGTRLDGPVRFAVLGDRTGGHAPGVFKEIVVEIERLKPDFTITVGDMIEGYTEDAKQIQSEWEEYLPLLAPLSAPVYHTPGNHDIWGDDDGDAYRLYNDYIGPPNYSFDYRGVRFVVMENGRWESNDELPAEKVQWLEKALEEGKDAPCSIVFCHKPFWYETMGSGKPDRLHELFKKYGVDAVFTGHYHLYFSAEYDGIVYTSMGSSGGSTMSRLTDFKYHYAWVTVDDDGIHIAPVKKESVMPHDVLTAKDLTTVSKIENEAFRADTWLAVDDDFTIEPATWRFTVKNPHETLTADATMRWHIPRGWIMEPSEIPIKLKPGEEIALSAKVACHGPLYPAPRFKLDMPYKPGRTHEFGRNVAVKRQAACARADTPLDIDGVVNEPDAWKQGESVLFDPKGGKAETDHTSFYFAHDRENIYIAAVCMESEPGKRRSFAQKRDDAVYRDDYVALTLAPPGQNEAHSLFQMYVNPNGSIYDQKIVAAGGHDRDYDKDWNVDCQVATFQDDAFWSIEIRLPAAQFGQNQVEPGDQWGVNFRRKQQSCDRAADWMVPFYSGPEYLGNLRIE